MTIVDDTGRHRVVVSPRRVLSASAGRLAIGIVAVAVAVISVRASAASLGLSYLTESATSEVIGLTAGLGLVAVGMETLRRGRRRTFGYLLAAAGVSWFLPEWADPTIGASLGFTLGLALAWLYPAVVGHGLLAVSGSSRPVLIERFIAAGYGLFVIALGILPTIGFDPRAVGCGFCPANIIEIDGLSAIADRVGWIGTALAVGWCLMASLFLVGGLVRSGPATRRVQAAIVIPGIAFLILVAVALGRTLVDAVPPTDPTEHLVRLGQAAALIAIAIGVGSEWYRARRARSRLARLVADLGESPPVGGLRDHLARILRDPALQLAYPVGSGALVDAAGRPVEIEPRARRTTSPILRDGTVVAVIEHDADVLRDSGEIDEVVAAARLGLEHERLQAEARSQLEALRSVRRRIVEAGDAHRKQLERDLHDGAQQHLIALSINLRFVERGAGMDDWIDEAAAELRVALDELRDVAHGIYPTVLGDEGLAAAVDALAEASPVTMAIVDMIEERFEPAIEVAAYHVVADTVRSAVGPVRIGARRSGDRLKIEVTASGIPEHVVEEVADRVGAVDGSLEIAGDARETFTLTAELPCVLIAKGGP